MMIALYCIAFYILGIKEGVKMIHIRGGEKKHGWGSQKQGVLKVKRVP